jgi:hypothetical protein
MRLGMDGHYTEPPDGRGPAVSAGWPSLVKATEASTLTDNLLDQNGQDIQAGAPSRMLKSVGRRGIDRPGWPGSYGFHARHG